MPIQYTPIITSIMAAQRRGATPDLIVQKIIEGNPEKGMVFQEALSRGASPQDILAEVIRQNYTPSNDQSQPGIGGIGGLFVGAAKGAASTLNNLSGLGQKALQKITGMDTPVSSLDPRLTTPNSTTQKIGFGAEQIAEFFIPAGAISKGAKLVEGASAISKLPKAAQGISKLAGKAVLEGAGAAGVTAAQGGNKSDVKTAVVLGGAFSVAAKGLQKIIQKIPETSWSAILKRTPTEAAKKPNLPGQAVKTGLTGLTRQSIANKAGTAIQSIEVTLDDLLSASKKTINPIKVAGYLEDLRDAYKAIPGEDGAVELIEGIQRKIAFSKNLTPLEANKMKRDIYGLISKSYGRGMLEVPAKTEAQKLVAAGLKREIEKIIPEAKTLNEKQAVYIQIKKALDKTIARTEGKGIAGTGIGLTDVLIGGLGTGAGALAGSPLVGLGLVAAKKTAESPIVLSATAKLLNYFNQLSPTKKLLFYEALKGLTVKGGTELNSFGSSKTE